MSECILSRARLVSRRVRLARLILPEPLTQQDSVTKEQRLAQLTVKDQGHAPSQVSSNTRQFVPCWRQAALSEVAAEKSPLDGAVDRQFISSNNPTANRTRTLADPVLHQPEKQDSSGHLMTQPAESDFLKEIQELREQIVELGDSLRSCEGQLANLDRL